MSRQIVPQYFHLNEKQDHKNKQNINSSPVKQNKQAGVFQKLNIQNCQNILWSLTSEKQQPRMALGENNQQFSQINTTSLGSIPFSKKSPSKSSKYYCVNNQQETYLQNLKPMKDVNTSLDDEIDDGEQCGVCQQCEVVLP